MGYAENQDDKGYVRQGRWIIIKQTQATEEPCTAHPSAMQLAM